MTFKVRACECGKSLGRYLKNGDDVEVKGFAVVIGISNQKLSEAVRLQNSTHSMPIEAWVFSDTYRKVRINSELKSHLWQK